MWSGPASSPSSTVKTLKHPASSWLEPDLDVDATQLRR